MGTFESAECLQRGALLKSRQENTLSTNALHCNMLEITGYLNFKTVLKLHKIKTSQTHHIPQIVTFVQN